jgi:cytidine deaminase
MYKHVFSMEFLKIETKVLVHENENSLSAEERELLQMAVLQLDKAYAPYSKFRVGAAVRLSDHSMYPGSNQENASYPLCMCGERVALYNAAANAPEFAPVCLAIVIRNEKKTVKTPVSPCGACRQVISEFENRYQQPIKILLKSDTPVIYELSSVRDILPLTFDAGFL